MKTYYELHVTFLSDGPESPSSVPRGWKFSRIDGDPTLGEGIKSYLTTQARESVGLGRIRDRLDFAANRLTEMGYKVLRKKIEFVLYDERIKL